MGQTMALHQTLGEILHDIAQKYVDKTCIIQAETGDSLTYAGFDKLVNQMAHGVRNNVPSANAYFGKPEKGKLATYPVPSSVLA